MAAQRLSGPRPKPSRESLLDVVRALRCIQIDTVAAPGAATQYLVPFSRLGPYDRQLLDDLVFKERVLFYYVAHAASLVLTEDFNLFQHLMRPYEERTDPFGERIGSWMQDNRELRLHVLNEIEKRGRLRSRDFLDSSRTDWRSSGWSEGRNVNRMLDFLWIEGELVVAGRSGNERLWDLARGWFPDGSRRAALSTPDRVDTAAEHSLRALGVARPAHIRRHFVRGEYPDLKASLARLVEAGRVLPAAVGGRPGWYLHRDSLVLLDAPWLPRTVLLSPFDNLIADRARNRELFGFDYTIEIYVPPVKRKRGYYAMPILAGDRIAGTVDARLDRARGVLAVRAAVFEDGFRMTASVKAAIKSLADFVGARSVE